MTFRFLVSIVLALVLATPALADRIFPQDAKRGEITGHQYPSVSISGKVFRMAPGARIYDQSNRTILPVALPDSGKVLYLTDMNGQLSKLWLLTPEEQATLGR